VDNAFDDRSVRATVDSGLAARGYHLASGGEADFLVTYRATVERRLDESTGGRTQESSDGWWGPSDDVGQEPVQQGIDYSREYDEGTLVLEFLSPTTKDMLWFASAKTEIFETDAPEERRRRIAETVAAMLERFPPK
jgi:hypothetical protein